MEILTQKEIAIQCLEKLNIYKPYITKFKSKASLPCFFENFAGFWVDQEPVVYTKMKEIEKEFGCLVYALTHENTCLGETWSMLCVPQDTDKIDDLLDDFNPGEFYVLAYVWNQRAPSLSEFGEIVVKTFGGGIKRIY